MDINKDKGAAFQPIEKKLQKSIDVILEAEERFGKESIALAWGGGKDSTALLWIVKSVHNGNVPFRVLSIDTSVMHKEVHNFRERISKEWKLDLIFLKHDDPITSIESFKDPVECCSLLKTTVLREGIKEYGIRAVLTGIRWDEHPACAEETWFSENEEPAKVNPLLHFMEKDIWNYIKGNNIPYCESYDKGYRHLGSWSSAWGNAGHDPGHNNASDKERIMETLRDLGYL